MADPAAVSAFPATLGELWTRLQSDLVFASWAWTLVAPVVAVALLFVTAPYSRHFSGRSLLRCTLPGALGWCLMEAVSPALFLRAFVRARGPAAPGIAPHVLALLWTLHYTYRALVYPLRRRRVLRPMPLEIALLSAAFNAVNGALNGAAAAAARPHPLVLALGTALWLAGLAGNVRSDETLRALRRGPADAGVYRVPPPVGPHRWLVSPNYSCEALEWLGYALASGGAPAAVSFAVWTLANLAPRALANYRWCVARFGPDMPRDRYVFIPFIW